MSLQPLLDIERNWAKQVKTSWDEFIDFVASDNVLQVAVGLIIAQGFTGVVNALVSDILLPPISLLPFLQKNLSEKFFVLKGGPLAKLGYNTLAQAADDGAVTMAYGDFLDRVVNFLSLGFCLYMIARTYTWVTHDAIITHTVKCKFCRKSISQKATRCYLCTSWQDGREDRETSAL